MNVKRISFLGIRARSAQGFTLIEILVASAVMALLVGLVITITSQVLNVWNRSGGRLSANQEARIAMELLTQDLETAVFRNNGLQWLVIENDTFTGPSGAFDNTVKIRLFTPALDRPTRDENDNRIPGDICAVSYELNYLNPVTGDSTGDRQFILYRRIVTPPRTFNDLMGDGPQNSLSGGLWQVDHEEDYLVSNIVEFRVDVFVEDRDSPNGISQLPIEPAIFGGTGSTIGPGGPNPNLGRPVFADIKLRVLSSEGANILQGQGGAANLDDIIREHATTFIRRVSFINRPF